MGRCRAVRAAERSGGAARGAPGADPISSRAKGDGPAGGSASGAIYAGADGGAVPGGIRAAGGASAGPNGVPGMKIVMFYHSLLSDWNHGNAHFLRGVAGELVSRGHVVQVYEPVDAWSVQ